jgi:hypothetical protein
MSYTEAPGRRLLSRFVGSSHLSHDITSARMLKAYRWEIYIYRNILCHVDFFVC